jgi:hypothetical protein
MHPGKLILALFFSTSITVSFAQQPNGEGYFTSEASAITLNEDIIVSIKKYNPTPAEIANAGKPPKDALMNYLMLPFEATSLSLYDKGFESNLYCLGKEGNVKWSKTIGYSHKSIPSPVKQYNGFLYTGDGIKDADKVSVKKIDPAGKVIWETVLDSLQSVNDIYLEGNKVSVLVSFDASKRLQYKDGTYSDFVYPIYFFVQLDSNGKKLSQEYQRMGNYLSSIGYKNPIINTHQSYFLNNNDSVIFLNTTKQEGATIVSDKMSKDNSILKVTGGRESCHFLTVLSLKNYRSYNIITDFYGKQKKYESIIPAEYNSRNKPLLYKNSGDSLLTVISTNSNVYICYTDTDGKSTLYKKTDDAGFTTVAAGEMNNKVYLVQVEGRNKPGAIGKLKIKIY